VERLTAQEALALLGPAVREAGEIGLRFARDGAETFTKADASPVTEADLAIDAHLASRLRDAAVGVGWLSEESADSSQRLGCRQLWIVDPIDGTRGFVAGNGEWVISAALVEDGLPLAGVLYRPTTGDFYEAGRGLGAFCNKMRLKVSDGSLGSSHRVAGPKPYVDALRPSLAKLERKPSLSSLALRLALLAEGRIDIALAKSASHDWDIAAAHAIVGEAGGLLTDLGGGAILYNRPIPAHPPLLGSGPMRHAELTPLLSRVAP
jgi:myo-inositol-1(or 4)-monophosphatase